MVVVTLLAFYFGDHSCLFIDLDADYIYFVGFLPFFALPPRADVHILMAFHHFESEVFFKEGGDRWYLVKVNFITLDEKTGVEKKTTSQILVQASDFDNAVSNFKEGMQGTMADYEIGSVAETLIMDVYPANLGAKTAE